MGAFTIKRENKRRLRTEHIHYTYTVYIHTQFITNVVIILTIQFLSLVQFILDF